MTIKRVVWLIVSIIIVLAVTVSVPVILIFTPTHAERDMGTLGRYLVAAAWIPFALYLGYIVIRVRFGGVIGFGGLGENYSFCSSSPYNPSKADVVEIPVKIIKTVKAEETGVVQEKVPYCTNCGKPEVFRAIYPPRFDRETGKRLGSWQCMTFGCITNHICDEYHHTHYWSGGRCVRCGDQQSC